MKIHCYIRSKNSPLKLSFRVNKLKNYPVKEHIYIYLKKREEEDSATNILLKL